MTKKQEAELEMLTAVSLDGKLMLPVLEIHGLYYLLGNCQGCGRLLLKPIRVRFRCGSCGKRHSVVLMR